MTRVWVWKAPDDGASTEKLDKYAPTFKWCWRWYCEDSYIKRSLVKSGRGKVKAVVYSTFATHRKSKVGFVKMYRKFKIILREAEVSASGSSSSLMYPFMEWRSSHRKNPQWVPLQIICQSSYKHEAWSLNTSFNWMPLPTHFQVNKEHH